MLDGCAGRIGAEIVAVFPVGLWPDGPRTKASAAIRADIVQDVLDAGTAKGAFKRANHRLRGIRRKSRAAVLASGSQFQHGGGLIGGARAATYASIVRKPPARPAWL